MATPADRARHQGLDLGPERPCPECGFDAGGGRPRRPRPGDPRQRGRLAGACSARADATVRPRPDVWSPLEYACHVRDVHLLFAERLRLMLAEDDAEFANWDQDATAVEERYDLQDPAEVGPRAGRRGRARSRRRTTRSRTTQWERRGTRSNGACSPSRRSAATTCTTSSTTCGTCAVPTSHEAHRVLGRLEHALGAGYYRVLGRAVRDRRPRRPHRRRRRSTPACRPSRCGARSGRPSSCRRASDDHHRGPRRRRRAGPAPHRAARWCSPRPSGALGITIGIATASLLARDLSGSESQAGLAQTFQVLGAAVASYLLARLMSRRGRRIGLATGYLLGARRGGARGGRRRRRLDAAAARRRGAARLDDRGQQRRALRRHRPRARGAPGPGAVDRGLGDHDRRGRRPQPHRPVRGRRRPARHPRADRPVRARQRRDALGGAGGRRPAAPRPAAARPRARRRAAGRRADRHRPGAGRVAAVRERPVLGCAVARPRRARTPRWSR